MTPQWIRTLVFLAAGLVGSAAATEVVIKEWDVPTARSRPHDPEVAPDGSLWYTVQLANKLGRLDPKAGEIKEWTLKTPGSGPHGLVADREGSIWYTGNAKAHIGKLNPKTGQVTEYPMPDPRARDPHTPVFDQRGILWFTVQGGNFVGRLDPKTGTITLKEPPTPKSRPYGIATTPDGMIWYSESGVEPNTIVQFDPKAKSFDKWPIPSGGGVVRHVVATPQGDLYIACSGVNMVGIVYVKR